MPHRDLKPANVLVYDVRVSAPVGRLDEAQEQFDAALDSFTAAH